MGAVLLTPGAAIVPFTDDLLEQCEWLAQRIGEHGGEAWVLPVSDLSEREEEYGSLRREAEALTRPSKRAPTGRKLLALERGFSTVLARDHFAASGRGLARRAIARAGRARTA